MREDISTYTIYDGTRSCRRCGTPLDPVQVLFSPNGLCPDCSQQQAASLISNGMVQENPNGS